MNFLGAPRKIDKKSTKNVIEFIKKYLIELGIECTIDQQIMATEIECTQPDCVPIETLVVLLGKVSRWTSKIMKPISEVSYEDVCGLDIPLDWDSLLKRNSSEPTEEGAPEVGSKREAIALQIESFFAGIDDKNELRAQLDYFRGVLDRIESSNVSVAAKSTLVAMRPREEISTNPIASNPVAPSPPVNLSGASTFVKMVSVNAAATNSTSTTKRMTVVPMMSTISATTTTAQSPQVVNMSNSDVIAQSMDSNINLSGSSGASYVPGATVSASNRSFRTTVVGSDRRAGEAVERHSRGVRQRGCPCCDPDNIDNIVDKMLYMDV